MMLQPPALLTDSHDAGRFSCGHPALDDWLRRRALSNQTSGASRTYVVCSDSTIVGYYALAVGSVAPVEVSARIRRNMPDPIPVMILGRLAIDEHWHGKGLGSDLLRDAILRTQRAADIAGIRALLVHAIDEKAAEFYANRGFMASSIKPLMLLLPLTHIP